MHAGIWTVAFIMASLSVKRSILRELGIDSPSSVSSAYSPIHNHTLDDIVERQCPELKELFNITVENNMCTLPDIYIYILDTKAT